MKKIVIFSGTTEGRTLSELFSGEKISHCVCVASDYGREMMAEDPYADIHVGRMDAKEMGEFLKKEGGADGCIVIDATHPYAEEVTANIRSAALLTDMTYIRVRRERQDAQSEGAFTYSDIRECAGAMEKSSGNILLTTGSKELHAYSESVSEETRSRTFVRVLPSEESLRLCRESGISPDHIIAMQGPFLRELNEAIIRQYDIRHLIAKESGAAGGFAEKRDAAERAGACLHVIARPGEDEGVGIEEAFYLATGKEMTLREQVPHVAIVGVGMGSGGSLTLAALEELENCDAAFGASRLLRDITAPRKYEVYRPGDIIPVLEKEKIKRAVIAYSGDIGFFSGAKVMTAALREWKSGIDISMIPGISSFAYLAAKLCESYDDACLFSIHGRKAEKDLSRLIERVRYNEKTFVLLSGASDVAEIAERLLKLGKEGSITVGKNLSYEDETIREMTFEEAAAYEGDGIVTAFIRNSFPERRPLINVRRDCEFIRSDIPMTKECIRHESIIRLGLREGDVLYDIGGGTGSVAVEAASLSRSLKVFTIERKQEAADLIRENIAKFDLDNVTVIKGRAEQELGDMPKPDCVFIGGSDGKLRQIVNIIHSKGTGIRFVINAVSLETVGEVREIIRNLAPLSEESVMITVSDVRKVGTHHMMQGQNPVWIFSFTI